MRRLFPVYLVFAAGIAVLGWWTASAAPQAAAAGDAPPAGPALPMDRLEFAGDRPPCEGLIESEDPDWVYMIQIRRPEGRPMYLVIRPVEHASVQNVVRLDAADREKLRGQIEEFRNRAAIEAGRMEAVHLEPFEADGNHYRRYRGRWFTLDSTAGETMTRRVVVRTEQIFAAYRQILPPRTTPAGPPRLVLFGSMAAYQTFLDRLGIRIQNRACFLVEKNLVVVGSELDRLVESMAKTIEKNEDLRRQLKELEEKLSEWLRRMTDRLHNDGVPEPEIKRLVALERGKFGAQVKAVRKALDRSDRELADVFRQSTRQMFARLAHECFHAHLENYVYPRARYDVPSWLNEGLAVMFEGGMLENETLRIDAPNSASLKKVQSDLAGGQPMSLEKLIRTGPSTFLAMDRAGVTAADRNYAYAWGLAYYLTFHERLLGSPRLDRYVKRGDAAEPAERFKQLVNMPLEQFEGQWREYVRALKSPR